MVVTQLYKITPTVIGSQEVGELSPPSLSWAFSQPVLGHFILGEWVNPQDDSRFVSRVASVIHMGIVYDALPVLDPWGRSLPREGFYKVNRITAK